MNRQTTRKIEQPAIWLLLLLSIGLGSCRSDGARDIRSYYFPLEDLEEGMVYEYRAVNNDSLTPKYWYYRSFIGDEGIFLTSTYYEYDLAPLQFAREEMVRNGMIQDTLYLLEYQFSEAEIDSVLFGEERASILITYPDSSTQVARVDVDILSGTLFPFEVRPGGGVFLYKVQWRPASQPDAMITLGKTRQYAGDTTFTFQGKTYDCVRFAVNELFQHDREGMLEQEYGGIEWYAKNIGLVYYRKDISDDLVLEYALHDRYPMEKLEEQFLRRQETPEIGR